MGLFKGITKTLKKVLLVNPVAKALRNVPRDLGRMAKDDPLKFAIIVGASALTGGAAAGAAGVSTATGMAAGAGVGAGLSAQSGKAMHEAKVGEERAKELENIKEAEYNQQVATANERAYQQNRASLLSARREYGKKIGTAYVRAGARTSDETESKLG